MNDISKRNVKETLKCSVIKNLRLLEPKITMQEIADWLGVTKAHVGKWEYGDANMSRSSMLKFLDRILQRRMAYKLALESFLDTVDENDQPELEKRLKNYQEVMNEAIKAAPDDYKEKRGFEKEEVLKNEGEKTQIQWSFPDLGVQQLTIEHLTKKISGATDLLEKLKAVDELQKFVQKQMIMEIYPLQMMEGPLNLTKINTRSYAKYNELVKEKHKSEELTKREIETMYYENDQLKRENQLQKLESESKILRLEGQLKASDLRIHDKEELVMEMRERIKGMEEIIRELRERVQSRKIMDSDLPV